MPTFVLMTKLSPDVSKRLSDRAKVGRNWLNQVKSKCPEDFMDIYEAPSEETAAKVSMISLANGALKAESWSAIPYQRFLELTEEL